MYRLQKQDGRGATRVWIGEIVINDDGPVLTSTFGTAGGKMQTKAQPVLQGKQGRTALQQAQMELDHKASVKRREGYTENEPPAVALKPAPVIDAEYADVPLPMLAVDIESRWGRLPCDTTGVFLQPKLDGVRAIGGVGTGKLWSRTHTEYTSPVHIAAALCALPAAAWPWWLDGELYCHGMTFNAITSLARQKVVKDPAATAALQYHVYDVVAPELPTRARMALLRELATQLEASSITCIVVVRTDALPPQPLAMLQPAVMAFHAECTRVGYEGAMVRLDDAAGYQTGRRATSLLKVKAFMQSEFPLVGFEPEKGAEDLVGAMVLQLPDGRLFRARPAMTVAERRALNTDGGHAPGTQVTVKYFELTPDNVPRFPIALGFVYDH